MCTAPYGFSDRWHAMKQPVLKPQVIAQMQSAQELYQRGQSAKALEIIQRVLARHPRAGAAHNIAVGVNLALAQNDRALYHAQQSLQIEPNNASYHLAMGNVLTSRLEHAESVSSYKRALEISPGLIEAINGLGIAYKETGRNAESASLFDQLIELEPENASYIINRATLYIDMGQTHEAVVMLDSASKRFETNPILHDMLALTSSYDSEITPQQAFEFHRRYGSVLGGHIRARATHSNTPERKRRIRIGYISGNFHQHSNSSFLIPILENHNHDQFEIFLYSTNGYTDQVTEHIKATADHWRPLRSSQLRETVDTILRDKIDILIELSGHFAHNSLPIMAAKPAPVQVTYLGYANTTGLDAIDYRIIDGTTDPSPQADSLNTEKLIRLDGCFLTYQPHRDTPDLCEPATDRPFTFASFNSLKKLTEGTIRAWADILNGVDGSRLMLKNKPLSFGESREEVVQRFVDLGIDRSRIVAIGTTDSIGEHLGLYNDVDLALDTFPYNGTTTTCEALWMGVPVLTFAGNTHAHRVSASILKSIGREDLCTNSTDEYVRR
ncbi:MAG: tetratricopeptide repeat protein, partial [Phycisphaerales bacterium]|nr:tetratricopeptide repeat protein [Phycisphaerales bacterium]